MIILNKFERDNLNELVATVKQFVKDNYVDDSVSTAVEILDKKLQEEQPYTDVNTRTIQFVFDDEKDRQEVIDAISKKSELIWKNDTRQSSIATFVQDGLVMVGRSKFVLPPTNIRL